MINANSSPNNNSNTGPSPWDSLKSIKNNNSLGSSKNNQVSEFEEQVQRRVKEMDNRDKDYADKEYRASLSHEEKALREYQKKSAELDSITERKKTITNNSETRNLSDTANFSVEEYKTYNSPRGFELSREVGDLKKQVEDAPRQDRLEREAKLEKEQKKFNSELDQIVDTAIDINQEKINEYNNLSFVEKWKIRLKGEKPKKLSKKEALIKHGEEAVDRMMRPVEERLEEEYNALVEVNKEIFSDPVEVEARRRRGLTSSFDDVVKQLKFEKEFRAKKHREGFAHSLGYLNERFRSDPDANKNFGSN